MSFEDRFLGHLDRRRETRQELSPSMERAYRKALTTLRSPDYAIQEEEFEGVYPTEEVRADRSLALHLRSKFDMNQNSYERTSKQIADIFEALVLEETELSNWFGENAHTFKAADYDDYKNKVDMIAEWSVPEGSRVIGLAVDATYGTDSIRKKMEQIKDEIDRSALGSIKYFKYADGRLRREPLQNVPRIVLGVSKDTVEELARLWVENDKRQLGEHPVQKLFLLEMELQLDLMEKYARRIGNETAAHAYRDALAAITPIEKQKRVFDLGRLSKDPVAIEIISRVRGTFGSNESIRNAA